MYQKSKFWRTRPSELIGLDDPYVSYCFDDAIYTWGNFVEAEVEDAGNKSNKPKDRDKNRTRRLGELLALPTEQRFKSFRQSAGKAPVKE